MSENNEAKNKRLAEYLKADGPELFAQLRGGLAARRLSDRIFTPAADAVTAALPPG